VPAQSQNGIFIQRCKDATTRQNLSHARLKVHRENERLQLFNSLVQEVGHEHGRRREDSGHGLGGTRAADVLHARLHYSTNLRVPVYSSLVQATAVAVQAVDFSLAAVRACGALLLGGANAGRAGKREGRGRTVFRVGGAGRANCARHPNTRGVSKTPFSNSSSLQPKHVQLTTIWPHS